MKICCVYTFLPPSHKNGKKRFSGANVINFNNKNIRTTCKICSKLTIKTQDDVIDVSSLLILNSFYTLFWDFIDDFEQINAGWVITLQKFFSIKSVLKVMDKKLISLDSYDFNRLLDIRIRWT